jgi:hypothetical protein
MRIVTLVLCAVVIGAVQENPTHSIAFVGGTVVDVSAFGAGTGDIRDSVVIVEDGRIAAVGTRRATTIPRGATRWVRCRGSRCTRNWSFSSRPA